MKRSFPDKPLAFTKGAVYVLLHLHIGPVSFTVDIRPYRRAKTVRTLNRHREKAEKLTYFSKINLRLSACDLRET